MSDRNELKALLARAGVEINSALKRVDNLDEKEATERAIDATIAFADYVLGTYGRFPAHADACKSIVACQTHHLDEEFYATFYPDSTLPDAHREHMHVWHSH